MKMSQSSDENKSHEQLLQEVSELRLQLAVKDKELATLKSETSAAKGTRFQSMFDSIPEVFTLQEILLDSKGKPCDFRFLEINPTFERLTGLKKETVVGKRVREVFPEIESCWLDAFGQVAFEGKPVRIENYMSSLKNWYEVFAYSTAPGQVAALFTNITERKQSEVAFEETKRALERDRNILQSMADSAKNLHLVYLDPDFNFVQVNKAYSDTCGYAPDMMIGKNHFTLYPHEENEAIFARVRDSGVPVMFHDKPFVFPDQPDRGVTYWDWTLEPIKDASGRVEGLIFSLFETTERKQAEDALRLNVERFSTLVEASSEVLYRMSPDWREMHQLQGGGFLTDTNRPNRDWLQQYIHPADQSQVIAAIDEAIRNTSAFVFEHRVLRADGTLGWTFSRAVPLLDENGEIVEWFGAASDITERKRIEGALRGALAEAEEGRLLLEAMMEHIPMGITIADAPDVRIRRVSRYGRELTAKPREQIEGIPVERHAENWQIFCADGITPAANEDLPLTRATQKGEVVEEDEWVIGRPDGTKVPILCTAAPIRDAHGRITGGVIGWQDISERKQTEDLIKSSLAEKEVLLKEIHHRVKNNMQVISSLVNLQAAEIEDQATREIFQDVVYRIRSMAMVHEKLYQSSDLARVDFADYTQSLLRYLWRAQGSAASGIKLNLELKPVLLSANTAIPCGLILTELVSNTLKHAFIGRGSGMVTVALHGDGQSRVLLAVHDNGVGLPSGLDWQQSKSLGLRLVRILAGQLRGTIETETGTGTEFRVTFPLKGFQA